MRASNGQVVNHRNPKALKGPRRNRRRRVREGDEDSPRGARSCSPPAWNQRTRPALTTARSPGGAGPPLSTSPCSWCRDPIRVLARHHVSCMPHNNCAYMRYIDGLQRCLYMVPMRSWRIAWEIPTRGRTPALCLLISEDLAKWGRVGQVELWDLEALTGS